MPPKKRKSINAKKNSIICVQCKTAVLDSDESFQCDVCSKSLHTQCTQLNKVEIEKYLKDDSLEYKCHFCETEKNASSSDFSTLVREMREMKETMKFMSLQYDDILKGVKTNTTTIRNLKKENKNLREDVKQLKSTVSFLNNIRVQKDCIINGINAADGKSAVDVVLDIAKKTGADICEDEIEEVYFVNNRKQSTKSSVVVKFNNKKSKSTFMKEKNKLKNMDDMKAVYINDLLSKENLELLHHAKSLKSVGFKFVFAQGANIFVKKNFDSKSIRLKCLDDVDEMLMRAATGSASRVNRAGALLECSDDVSDDDEDDDDAGFLSTH